MKITRIIALALAMVTASALVACNNSSNDDTTTTTAGTTTTVSTTTKAPDNNPSEPNVPAEETPVTGLDLAALMGNGINLSSTITNLTLNGLTPFGENEGVDKVFDGLTSTTKLGGSGMAATGAEITWKTNVETIVYTYVLYTGSDSAEWKRTPLAWTLSGSTDGENWTVIDEVANSTMADVNSTPYGFEVDDPTGYTYYKMVFTKTTTDGQLQFNELVLIGDAAGATGETPVSDAAEIDAMLASGTNLTANIKDAAASGWSQFTDGEVVGSMFDGNTTGTKMGGSSSDPVVSVTWSTDVATTVKSYIIYTGFDSATWARTPYSWVLYGSNDGENWTIIDAVSGSGMVNSNSTPYGFTVESPAAYTQYTMCFTSALDQSGNPVMPGTNYQLQMNELVLIGDAAAAE
ncbi:MAG: hypothetical protein J6R82_00355 [Clostridia bacterium]|nr:hypothetical protein [Clostridia bacterium]